MTFRRTPSALHSLAIFFKADVVVFCEGGVTLSIQEAVSLGPSALTLDCIFWKSVVALFADNRRFHFKSVGSKTTLISIAEDVADQAVVNVTVCLDSDYDRMLNQHLHNPRVAYTHGYSWENDVLSEAAAIAVLKTLVGPLSNEVIEEVKVKHAHLDTEIGPWCEIDISLRQRRKPSLIDTIKPLSVVDLSSDPPRMNAVALRKRLSQVCGYRRAPRRVVQIPAGQAMTAACGKLIARCVYQTMIAVAKRIEPKATLSYENFLKLAISHTFDAVAKGALPDLGGHFQSQRTAF